MGETKNLTRQDKIAGIVLLVVGAVVSVLPDFQLAGQPINPSQVGSPWMGAAILLLMMDYAARPMPKLMRWSAVGLFVFGFIGPFLANAVNLWFYGEYR